MYQIMYNFQRNENLQFKWINDIKNILDDSGFSYLLYSKILTSHQKCDQAETWWPIVSKNNIRYGTIIKSGFTWHPK